MKLNRQQILQLYTFTEKHYVEWYDVQAELVDHLANGIEFHLANNPNTTFEVALDLEFKKFGVVGFGDVIEEKTKALNKRYRKLLWSYFLDFFRLPKIIITLFLIWLYYFGLSTLENRLVILIPTFVFLCFLPCYYYVSRFKSIKLLKRRTGKKWLFDNATLQLGGLNSFLNIGIYGSLIFDTASQWSTIQEMICSVLIVFFALALCVSIYVVSPKLRKDMAKQHPDYKFV